MIREARIRRPKGVQFLNNFSKHTLERRVSYIPEMLEAREQRKVAYMIMDRLIIRDSLQGINEWVVLKTKCLSISTKGNELPFNIFSLTCGNLNSVLFYFTLSYPGCVNLQYSYVFCYLSISLFIHH